MIIFIKAIESEMLRNSNQNLNNLVPSRIYALRHNTEDAKVTRSSLRQHGRQNPNLDATGINQFQILRQACVQHRCLVVFRVCDFLSDTE